MVFVSFLFIVMVGGKNSRTTFWRFKLRNNFYHLAGIHILPSECVYNDKERGLCSQPHLGLGAPLATYRLCGLVNFPASVFLFIKWGLQ